MWQCQVRDTKLKQMKDGLTPPEKNASEGLRRERLVAAEIEGNREREQFILKRPGADSSEKDELSETANNESPDQIPELPMPSTPTGLLRENSTEYDRVTSEVMGSDPIVNSGDDNTNKTSFPKDAQVPLVRDTSKAKEMDKTALQGNQNERKGDSIEQRVNDSVAIYKARKNQGQHQQKEDLGISETEGTHDDNCFFRRLLVNAMEPDLHFTKCDKPLVIPWNDSIDSRLTELVYEKSFNFLEVATSLQSENIFDGASITGDDCRLRWSAIDAADSQENGDSQNASCDQPVTSFFRSSAARLTYDDLQVIPSKLLQKPKDLSEMSDDNNLHDTGTTVLTRLEILNELTSKDTNEKLLQ